MEERIRDWATRNAVATVQDCYETMILDLLPQDDEESRDYLLAARERLTRLIKTRAPAETFDQAAAHDSDTLALAILAVSFERLLSPFRKA